MDRGTEETFFQRRHTDGQQVYKKVLTVSNHQGNADQNHNEMSPRTCQNGYHQKRQRSTIVGKDVEKGDCRRTVGGNVNWFIHNGKQYGDSSRN